MADVNINIPVHFCAILFIFLFSCGDAAVIMKQHEGCDDIEGTWALKFHPDANVSTYFEIKKSGDELRLMTSFLPDNLPFESRKADSPEDHYHSIIVRRAEFRKSIENFKSSSVKECLLTLRNGVIMEKVKNIKHVHLIYMNHLDVGYNTNQNYPGTNKRIPGYIINVLNWYFQVYFPRAARLGNELRDIKASETFKYTTHPWLVNLYLDCPNIKLSGVQLQCPSEEQLVNFRRAVWMGDITWHAGPMNQEPEASNPELFSYSLTLSQKLDDYFNIKRTARTLSQRDVPGMTRAAIPYMIENGIVAVSVGINPFSSPPDVPSPNMWKFGNYSILSYWHKGGYPNNPGPSPQQPGGLARKDCQMADGTDHALCFAFRTDNTGPPEDIMVIKNYFKILRFQFPGADIKASTFEAFTEQLLPLRNSLPVVDKEIGDTWITGPTSDPIKIQRFRTINRLRSKCIKSKQCDVSDKRVDDMSRLLLKLPEHTYGISGAFDQTHWTNEDFQPLQYIEEGYKNDTTSWLSHRAFNDLAVNALKNHPLANQIKQELKELNPYLPDPTGYEWHEPGELITCGNGIQLVVGPRGSLIKLTDQNGHEWADENNTLAEIMYRTYNGTDFKLQYDLYSYFGDVGINKPNMGYAKAESKFWDHEAHGVYIRYTTGDPCSQGIYVRVLPKSMTSWFKYGSPVSYFLKYQVNDGHVDIDYQFFNKPSTRLPEALFLNFKPKPSPSHRWYLHKLGYLIDPYNVVNNGSQYVHSIDEGVAYVNQNLSGLILESFDVATVCVQTIDHMPSPFPIPLAPLKVRPSGMGFNIFNNIWETNFIYWYPYQPQDKHYKARFRISFQ